MNKAERTKKLRDLVAYHQRLYHEQDSPELSDEAYDSLVRELRELEGAGEEGVSVANLVGGAPSEAFSKVHHKVRQWSLNNAFTFEDLEVWENQIRRRLEAEGISSSALFYDVGHKLDGLKIVLTYEKGRLVRAATRGDGVTGEDVTHAARTIKDIPAVLSKPVSLTCVGEVWLGEEEFHRINEERKKSDQPLFANPRNAAAGSLRQLDPSITASRKLSVIVYDLDSLEADTAFKQPRTQQEEINLLSSFGFEVGEYGEEAKSLGEVKKYYEKWQGKKRALPYGVDGIVVKVNDINLQKRLGYTAKAPRFAIAFKFPAEQATTVIEHVALQVGRTGVITPVAHLRPTLIAGSTVSRATLHNEDQIKRLDVRVGDTVILQKAGDVIPEIVSVVLDLRPEKTKPFRFPKKVDGCGGDGSIERIPGEAAYRCVALESDFIHRRRLYHFVSKTALNIDGVGPRVIDLLLEEGLIQEPADLFTLKAGDLEGLPGFKTKAAENAVNAIAAARSVELYRLLVALSIKNVGEETARLIAEHAGSADRLKMMSVEEVAAIHGVGSVVAQSLVSWMRDKQNLKRLNALLLELDIKASAARTKNTKLSGKTVVFTGTLPTLSRDDAKAMARKAGANVTESVSRQTDYVVVGESAGSKEEKARSLGISILSEGKFLKLIG